MIEDRSPRQASNQHQYYNTVSDMGIEGEQPTTVSDEGSDHPHDGTTFIHQQQEQPHIPANFYQPSVIYYQTPNQKLAEFDPLIHGPQTCPGVTAVVSVLLAIVSNASSIFRQVLFRIIINIYSLFPFTCCYIR